ncbi:MAG: ABC transporter substrate-binding protein [Gaiellaceae bacterium]
MRLRLTIGVGAALCALVAGSLAAGGAAAPATRQATTITLSGWASSPAETDLLKQTIAGFEAANPSIKVNYAPINGDYPAAMLAKFAARTPPDVFYVDSSVVPTWEQQGVLEPLDSYIKQTKFNLKPFYPKLLDAFRSKGKIYGLPKDWSPLALEYNKAMFQKAGIKSAPTNWAQLTQAAIKLKKSGAVGGGKPLCLAPDWARLLAFVYQNKGSFMNSSLTRMTLTSPATVAAVNFYVGLVKQGLAGQPSDLGVGWCGEALGKQKAGIIFEGNWLVPYMHETFPSVGYKIAPMVQNKTGGNLAFTVSYSMARDSGHKAEAWRLISYLTGKPGMRIWTSKGLALPSRSDVTPLGGRKAFLSQAKYARAWQFAPGFDKVITTAGNELTAVMTGKEPVQAMLSKIQSAGNDALKGG